MRRLLTFERDARLPQYLATDLHAHKAMAGDFHLHDRVDEIVHARKPESRRNLVVICMPTVQQHCDMVEPVQEDDWFFLEHEEGCIE